MPNIFTFLVFMFVIIWITNVVDFHPLVILFFTPGMLLLFSDTCSHLRSFLLLCLPPLFFPPTSQSWPSTCSLAPAVQRHVLSCYPGWEGSCTSNTSRISFSAFPTELHCKQAPVRVAWLISCVPCSQLFYYNFEH